MANHVVTIRVVAAADDSLRTFLKPLEESLGSAQKKGQAAGAEAAKQSRQRRSEEERNQAYLARVRDNSLKAEQREHDRANNERKRKAEELERYLSNVRTRTMRQEQREQEQVHRQSASFRRRMVADFGWRGVSNMGQVAGAAGRLGQDIARGAGYQFSIGGSMERSIELQRRATDLSNQGYIPSEGKGRIDPREVERRIKAASDATGFDRLSAAEGVGKFVGKTGDLDVGLKMLPALGKLAKASGSDLSDLADAAGDVSNAFKDKSPEERLKRTESVMRVLAGQGKIGAVEIKNLATQAAKLSSASGAFGGDAEKNLGIMGALTQMSRATGGSASATQAATSVQAFVNTLRTPARIKQFEKEGISLYDKKTGVYNDPEQIILQALNKTKGDPQAFKRMFANVQGARAVEGAAMTYRGARARALGGGADDEAANEAGLKAVRDEFERFRKISMSGGEIEDSFQARMGNQDSKSQAFNNKFDDIVEKMGEKLLPAIEKLEPVVLKAAESFTKLVTWAAENPGKAITLAIVGSIAKAGLETALRTGLESALNGAVGGKGGGGAVGGGGGMSMLGAGLTIFGASIAITGAGIKIIDAVFDQKDKANAGAEGALGGFAEARANAVVGGPSLQNLESLRETRDAIQAKLDLADEGAKIKDASMTKNALSGALNWASAGEYGTSFDRQFAAGSADDKRGELEGQLKATNDAIVAMKNKLSTNLNVTVTNFPAAGLGVDFAGRGTAGIGAD